jgi:hypothetical protein
LDETKGNLEESFYEDGKYDVDAEQEKILSILHDIERRYQNKDTELFNAADDLSSMISERRYTELIEGKEELEEKMKRLSLGEATQQEIRDYMKGSAGKRNLSRKQMKKYGLESSGPDIKGLGSLRTAPTILSTTEVKREVLPAGDSLSSVQPDPSNLLDKLVKQQSLEILELKKKLEVLNLQLSGSASPPEAHKQKELASNSKPQGLSNPEVAKRMLSTKGSKPRSKTTQ